MIEIQARSGLYRAFVTRNGEIEIMEVLMTPEKISLSHDHLSVELEPSSGAFAALTADTYYPLSCQAQDRFAM